MNYDYKEATPTVHPDASVCDEATVIGDVRIAADASVWPGAVLRGDAKRLVVGENTHIEDNTVLHGATIDDQVMVGHGAVIDTNATIENGTLIGSNATINNGVMVGKGTIVASGAVVPDGTKIPSSSFVRGVPAVITPVAETSLDADAVLGYYSPDAYQSLIEGHDALFGGSSG